MSIIKSNTDKHVTVEFDSSVTESNIIHSMFYINCIANGTPQSLHFWAKKQFHGNIHQQRAFKILGAKFILIFCNEAHGTLRISDNYFHDILRKYHNYILLLQEMVGKWCCTEQLLMFLTGPIGSGKNKIISQLMKYGELFCKNIKQPFTTNTILLTAYSTSNATLIGGQTVHSTLL
jgi:hypothetical protein